MRVLRIKSIRDLIWGFKKTIYIFLGKFPNCSPHRDREILACRRTEVPKRIKDLRYRANYMVKHATQLKYCVIPESNMIYINAMKI